MAISEHTLSEFLQHSGEVLPGLERGEIILRRRDGEDLIVMTRGQNDALATTLRVLAGMVRGNGTEQATAILPWFAFLSSRDQKRCLEELGRVASAAVANGELSRLEETLYQWESTGLAAWDDQRLRERSDYDDYAPQEPVELARPGR
jgi:hypothetical protein